MLVSLTRNCRERTGHHLPIVPDHGCLQIAGPYMVSENQFEASLTLSRTVYSRVRLELTQAGPVA